MMAMDRNPNSYAFALAMEHRGARRWSRGAIIGVGVSALLHVALFASLYALKVHTGELTPVTDPPPVVITTWRMPHPTPQLAPAPRQVQVHATPAPTQPTPTLDATPPQPTQAKVDDQPPVLTNQVQVTTPPPAPPKQITDPTWISRPSADQMARFYPPQALDNGLGGVATLNCMVNAGGKPLACQVLGETPTGHGFGAAAVKLAAFFKMSPRTEDGQPVDGGTVRLSIRFDPGE